MTKPWGTYSGYKWGKQKCPKCGKKTKMVYGRKGVQRTACCLVDMPQEAIR